MDCAGPTEALPAAILCAGKLQVLPDDPDKRHVSADVQLMFFAIDLDGYHMVLLFGKRLSKMRFRVDYQLPKKMLPYEQGSVNR
jgi:hypothetical protein